MSKVAWGGIAATLLLCVANAFGQGAEGGDARVLAAREALEQD